MLFFFVTSDDEKPVFGYPSRTQSSHSPWKHAPSRPPLSEISRHGWPDYGAVISFAILLWKTCTRSLIFSTLFWLPSVPTVVVFCFCMALTWSHGIAVFSFLRLQRDDMHLRDGLEIACLGHTCAQCLRAGVEPSVVGERTHDTSESWDGGNTESRW